MKTVLWTICCTLVLSGSAILASGVGNGLYGEMNLAWLVGGTGLVIMGFYIKRRFIRR